MNFYERECRVSVIVPVYNALCDLKLCVESLKKYVKFNIDQVIIIDDCSPDPAVKVYLEELKTQGFNIIFNEKNLGFSCTVNKGMELTDSDVILLNSDTVVTSGWIDKIVQCAYSDNSIATVTPFSNAATICSLPIFLQENKIPKGFTIDQYAEVVERCSMKKYPEISVAVGFCMFIKRTVINEIGLFDAESFKKGYGEENDFCWRASEYGYIHVLCDDTFIYHKGTGSFSSKEKMQLMQSHDTILQERYPELYQKNSIFCSYDQSRDIRLIIELFSKTSPKCKNILYVLHNDFRNNSERPCGGTEFHVRDLTYLLRNDFNIFVIYPSGGGVLKLTLYTKNEEVSLTFSLAIGDFYKNFHNRELANLLRIILSSFRIDLVHVHHTMGLSLDIFYEAAKQNIPIIATIHDFYSVCPSFNFLDYSSKYCCQKDDLDYCAECLWNKFTISKLISNYLQKWRVEYLRALSLCNELITPSESAKDIVLNYYPDLKNKLIVIEHGSNSFHMLTKGKINIDNRVKSYFDKIPDKKRNVIEGWIYLEDTDSKANNIVLEVSNSSCFQKRVFVCSKPRADIASAKNDNRYLYSGFCLPLPLDLFPNGQLTIRIIVEYQGKFFSDGKKIRVDNKQQARKNLLNIAFIGAMTKNKGSEIFASLIKKGDTKFTWHSFGEINRNDWSKKIKKFNQYYEIGHYKREHLQSLIDFYSIDLICILSIWPETFSYTLSEAILCGLPVIATDLGALGERVKKMDCGWLVSPDNAVNEIINLLQHLYRDSDKYKIKKAIVQNVKIKNVREMVNEYRQKYIALMQYCQRPKHSQLSVDDIKLITADYLKVPCLNTRQNIELEILRQKETLLNDICNSLSFKIMLLLKKLLPSIIKYPLKMCILSLVKIYKMFHYN